MMVAYDLWCSYISPYVLTIDLFINISCFISFQTGTCALFFAAQGGFLDIVKELLSHGAPVDLPSYVSMSGTLGPVRIWEDLFTIFKVACPNVWEQHDYYVGLLMQLWK